MFILLSIFSKLDIKDDLIDMFEQSQKAITAERLLELKKQHKTDAAYKKAVNKELNEALEKRGIRIVANLVVKVMSTIGNVKNEINTLLAQLCEVDVKEIKALKIAEYTQLVVAFFKKPELRDFLESIMSLLQSDDPEVTNETGSTS